MHLAILTNDSDSFADDPAHACYQLGGVVCEAEGCNVRLPRLVYTDYSLVSPAFHLSFLKAPLRTTHSLRRQPSSMDEHKDSYHLTARVHVCIHLQRHWFSNTFRRM